VAERDESADREFAAAKILPITEPAFRGAERLAVADGDSRTEPAELLARGATLGRYLILDRLGAGGMGVVYAAYDPELDRKVAVKLLRDDQTRDCGARLLREAQAMARLQHPNVIAVHDVGTLAGRVFVAMEFVEGETLGNFLSSRALSWRQVVELYVQAGRGLQAAHAAGLVHRDFKPDNALVGRDGRVRVLDFGLARAALAGSEHEATGVDVGGPPSPPGLLATPMTLAGAVVGTPAYIAPEQFAGQPADARSDQYSFAVALYGALYRRLPFPKAPLGELIALVTAGRIEEAPAGVKVPRWLRAVVLKGMATVPAERYADLAAFLTALADDPAARRRRLLLRSAAVAIVVLGLGAGWWAMGRSARLCDGAERHLVGVWDPPRKSSVKAAFTATGLPFAAAAWSGVEQMLDGYTASWAEVRTEACLASQRGEQSPELLDLRMTCLDHRLAEVTALGELLEQADAELVEKAVPAAAALSGLAACSDGPALLAPVAPPRDARTTARVVALRDRLARARVLREAGLYAQGLAIALPAASEAREIGYRPLESEAFLLAGSLHNSAGALPDAEREFLDSVIAAEAGHDRRTAAAAAAYLVHVVGYRLARFAEGHLWARHAAAFLEGSGAPGEPDAFLANQLGNLLHKEGRREEALTEQRRAVALYAAASGAESLDLAQALNSLGNALRRVGQYEEAQETLARALAIRERLLGPDHPLIGHSLNNLGTVAVSRARLDEAQVLYLRALSNFEKGLGAANVLVAITANNLAEVAMNRGQFDEAERYMQRALAIDRQNLGEAHPDVAVGLSNLAEVQMRGGRVREALATFTSALEVKEKALGPNHPSVATTLLGIAEAWRQVGNPVRSLPFAERALAYHTAHAGEPVDLASARWVLARSLWAANVDRNRALRLAGEARQGFAAVGEVAGENLAQVDQWLLAVGGGTEPE
jgi:eukaryotic-like serine/threonine-protein kinase